MAAILVLLVLLLVASITDVTRHKIYNWNTYPGIVAGFAVNLIAADGLGPLESLAGFLVCAFVMLVCFLLFRMGGGDVKLIAMMGAFLGVREGVEAMLWTFVLGGIAGTAVLIWQIGILRIISKTVQHMLLVLRAKSWVPLTREEREPLRRCLFLAPSAFVAVCVVAMREQQLFSW